ncbi:adhesion G-protein coupled receptor G6 isoform X2 [Stigmatopora nigra]
MAARRRAGGVVRLAVILMWAGLRLHGATVLGCERSECGGDRTEPEGALTSPCYPQNYGNSANCRWKLRAPPGFAVQISFQDFELEEAPGCIYDRLVVGTGSGEVKFCGLTAAGLVLNSSGDAMELRFTSDFSVQKRGFKISFRHVAVALRNLKVSVASDDAPAARVASSAVVPTLGQLTLCLEMERAGVARQAEWIFTYAHADGVPTLALGAEDGRVVLVLGGATCSLDSVVSPADWTSSMSGLCLLWESSGGRLGVYFKGDHWSETCSDSAGRSVPGGGTFGLGGPSGFGGNVYNVRLWNYTMTAGQLETLACHAAGNVIDWDNGFWHVPPACARTDATLSCSATPASDGSLHAKCERARQECPSETTFYRLAVEVRDQSSTVTAVDVEGTLTSWLNETLGNWTGDASTVRLSVRPQVGSSFFCRALLRHRATADDIGDVRDRIFGAAPRIGAAGLEVRAHTLHVSPLEHCPEEHSVHYRWPQSRPGAAHFLPCFPNKERSATRSCLISFGNFSTFWSAADFSNCTDIDAIRVSAENAAEVAAQLAAIADNQLSREEVSKVVGKVQEIVDVANINSSLASAVVAVISNVMSSPHGALAHASDRALKAVDHLLGKLQFEGSSVTISSKRLALGVSAFDPSVFNGTSFSAFIPTNANDPQIAFKSEGRNPLARITLPPSLPLGSEDSLLTRINFLFFTTASLFKMEQDGRALVSYVVASSVGNRSIRNLKDPVEIHIAHLSPQSVVSPVCVFWDFGTNGGSGGWNGAGCRPSVESGVNGTICLCDHLTHFAVLMDISGVSPHIDGRNNRILTFVTFVGCGVSAVFSAATLLTYVAFEKLRRDYPSKILMNLSASLLLLNLSFLLNGWLSRRSDEAPCLAAAALLHYFLLTSFTWMGLESVHMYIALVKVFNTYVRRYILKFCLLGWGVPAVLVGSVLAVDKHSYGPLEYGGGTFGEGSSQFCWIRKAVVFYVVCVAYFCLIFLLNAAMFAVVMLQICGRNGKRYRTLKEEVLRNLRSVVSLTFLLGMTWAFAFFAWGPVSLVFVYLFAIFNSLQGLFIFLFHCALKENVQKQWRHALCCARFRLVDNNSDWSKTASNNTKKATSEQAAPSLSSGSFASSAANWTAKAKVTLTPFINAEKAKVESI